MAHRKVNSRKHLKDGEIFFETPLKIAQKCLYLQFFLHIPINHDVKASEKI